MQAFQILPGFGHEVSFIGREVCEIFYKSGV